MSHDLAFTINGKAAMAYVGETPWHGLGQALTAGAPLETWITEAGFNYTIQQAPLQFARPDGSTDTVGDRVANYRSDTGEYLSIVGTKYNIVQPHDIMEFFRDLTTKAGFQLETAGVLAKGTKYWAMARVGDNVRVGGGKGKRADTVAPYLLLATACDGSLRTTATLTSVRTVCQNTLHAALGGATGAVKVSHCSQWTPERVAGVKAELGIDAAWSAFMGKLEQLAQTPVTDDQAKSYILDLFGTEKATDPAIAAKQLTDNKAPAMVYQLFNGKGRGSELASAQGTAFGLLNAVTEYVDYLDGGGQDQRLQRAWFVTDKNVKDRAFAKALELVAA